jgi:serine/threonine-protein kinase
VGPGSVVAGRFELLARLGAGGMGAVYKARDRQLGETVAVKVLRFGNDAKAVERFHSEVRLARRVKHRNVCGVYEYGEDGDVVFCAMELVSGRNLRELLLEAPLPRALAYQHALAAASGLQAIHEVGVIHRDIKAANLMIDARGDARLVDFGIAKSQAVQGDDSWAQDPGLTDSRHIVGSPEYMSPEQIRGLALDARSDIYSFGVLLYELFTGRLPFQAEAPVILMAKHLEEPPPLDGPVAELLPPELVPVLRKALAKEPAARYRSMADLVRDLRSAQKAHARSHTDQVSIASGDSSGSPRRTTDHLAPWADPGRIADRMTKVAMIGLAALAVGVVGILVLRHRGGAENETAPPAPEVLIPGPAVSPPASATSPTPVPAPTASPTPGPSSTPRPARPTHAPRPPAVPTPTPTATPLPTPSPTPTPSPAPMPPPTPTPAPLGPTATARPALPRRGDVLSADDPEVVRPQCLECPPATYSPVAERLQIEGDVLLALVVDEDGRVTEARVLRSDDKVLEDPALRGVRKWRYRPATKLGVPGKMHIEVTVKFRLRS